MKNHPSLSQIYQELLICYHICIKNKPRAKMSMFHQDYEALLYNLAEDISLRNYAPQPSSIFVVSYPKPREIIAAALPDRVVHHMIYRYMSPYWERRFSEQSFACRTGRGPIKAVKQLTSFVTHYKRHESRRLYALKVDVASFFPSIDRNILKAIILKKLKHPMFRYLVTRTIDHNPTQQGEYLLKSKPQKWLTIPSHKSLFHTPLGKGLPIGNLTSQFFANVYLNKLDQFISHHVKVHYWQRYVDDLVFLSPDLRLLKRLPRWIDDFLRQHLALHLNPTKTIIQPIDRGIDHLGYWIKPTYTLVRRKNVHHCKAKLNARLGQCYKPHDKDPMLASYLGLFSHADSHRLRQSMQCYAQAVDLLCMCGQLMTSHHDQ